MRLRQSANAARLLPGGPPPLGLATPSGLHLSENHSKGKEKFCKLLEGIKGNQAKIRPKADFCLNNFLKVISNDRKRAWSFQT